MVQDRIVVRLTDPGRLGSGVTPIDTSPTMADHEVGDALSGRVAVVEGASQGIGRALAVGFAAQGATVVASARSPADLDEAVEELRGYGHPATAVVADASEPDGARAPVERAVVEHGRIDILVNCVGQAFGSRDPFELDGGFEESLRSTLLSAWWATNAALPHMRERGYGRILSVGAASTLFGVAGPGYTAGKHGLVGMTRAIAVAAGPFGITANCLSPGWTNTPRLDWEGRARRSGTTVAEVKAIAGAENAQGRVLEPIEMVGMAVLLASAAGGGITGQDIHVDGGYRI